jgi:hypothetical protein
VTASSADELLQDHHTSQSPYTGRLLRLASECHRHALTVLFPPYNLRDEHACRHDVDKATKKQALRSHRR